MKYEVDARGLYLHDPSAFRTFTGRVVNPLTLGATDIDTHDIAHSLSRICRFGGHSFGHISVARHSLWVTQEVKRRGGTVVEQLAALLHDAAEAYVGDMVRPLKHMPGMEAYLQAEANVELAIARRYNIPHPLPALIKEADAAVLLTRELTDAFYFYDSPAAVDEADWLRHFTALVLARGTTFPGAPES